MAIPVGFPAWTRTASIEQYGGDLAKRNWGDTGAIDALTDVTAEQLSRLTADLAAVVRVSPIAVLRIVDSNARSKTTSASLADIQVVSCACQWGVATTSYQADTPPAGFPAVVVDPATIYGRGYTIDLGTSQDDDYGIAGAIAVRAARVEATTGTLEVPQVTFTGATVSFVIRDAAGDEWTGGADITVSIW